MLKSANFPLGGVLLSTFFPGNLPQYFKTSPRPLLGWSKELKVDVFVVDVFLLQQVLDVFQEWRRAAEVKPVAVERLWNDLLQGLLVQAADVDLTGEEKNQGLS